MMNILKEIAFIGNLDIFNTEEMFFDALFDFRESETFSAEAEFIGMDGSIFMVSIGPLFIIMMIWPVYFFVVKAS